MAKPTIKRKSVKGRVVENKFGKGILNMLINKLPFELHIPGYNFCGPGTKLQAQLARGDVGINKLDDTCKLHDIAYAENTDINSRHVADLQLAKKAWERVVTSDSTIGEKAAALLVSKLMKGNVKMGASLKNKKKLSNLHIAIKPKAKKVIQHPTSQSMSQQTK